MYVCASMFESFDMHINTRILRGNVTVIIIKNFLLSVSRGAQRGFVANPTGCITLPILPFFSSSLSHLFLTYDFIAGVCVGAELN